MSVLIADLVGYTALSTELGPEAVSQPTATVDLMAGARIWSVDNDIDISLSAGGPTLAAFSPGWGLSFTAAAEGNLMSGTTSIRTMAGRPATGGQRPV